MDAFEKASTVEDLFKELDEHNFSDVAKPLGAYRNQLMTEGFTRREAMRLVEAYSKFVYDVALEGYIATCRQEEIDSIDDTTELGVDEFDDSEDD